MPFFGCRNFLGIVFLNSMVFCLTLKQDSSVKHWNDRRNANSGLRKEESIGNRRLFGFDGIGNESRKDMNQKINRGSMASVFNF